MCRSGKVSSVASRRCGHRGVDAQRNGGVLDDRAADRKDTAPGGFPPDAVRMARFWRATVRVSRLWLNDQEARAETRVSTSTALRILPVAVIGISLTRTTSGTL